MECCWNDLGVLNTPDLKQLCRIVRKSILMTISNAGAGHAGGSLSEVEILVALYFKVMNVKSEKPQWPKRDRFILSKGHSSAGLYCVLAEKGYFNRSKLLEFDAINSMLQGHPCMIKTPGVDMSTGSLGQGLSAGIGIVLGRNARGMNFNVYVLIGDGELQEGQNWEAAMYAGSHCLGGLIGIIDYNKVQLTGTTQDVLGLEPLADKWKAFGWQVVECDNGNDIEKILASLKTATQLSSAGPVMVIAHTIKGKGVSFMEGKYQWHGKTPTKEEYLKAVAELDNCQE